MLSQDARCVYSILKKWKKNLVGKLLWNSELVARDINIKGICGREWDFFGGDLNERALSVIEF